MNRRLFLQTLSASGLTTFAQRARKPNFVVILADDLGYGDLGCYGSPNIRTPNLDRMAREGIRFTSFYAQPVCGPSRSALLTGCYPPRNSLSFNHLPGFETGIHPAEITLPEVLHLEGYTSMMIGKWHLGDHPKFLPLRHGFDRFFGLPYSNDMWRFHPRMPLGANPHPRLLAARQRAELTGYAGQGSEFSPSGGFPQPLPLYEDDKVIETDSDQTTFTSRFTAKALEFISANQSRPFFLYLAHVMPHVPLFAGQRFSGTSRRGRYGDTVEELDWSVGEILARIQKLGIANDTLVLFASDNGPWLQYGIDGGSAGPLRNGKGTHWEGGIRVPAIFRWPGKIPASQVTSEMACTMDLLPTLAKLAGAKSPADRVIDGKDIWPLLSGQPGAKTPHDAFFYFGADLFGEPGSKGPTPGYEIPKLQAVRSGDWKLHVDEKTLRPTALYDLSSDVGESKDLLVRHAEIGERLHKQAAEFVAALKRNIRPLGRI